MDRDTIGAISTGMTNSGIGIVRIIGDESFSIIEKIYKGKKNISKVHSHTINHGFIMDGEDVVDEVLVSIMKGPKTYTGEDTVEINCHGGTFVVHKVLDLVIKAGARGAEPGEITKRAFLNGKMDLSQSEAVIDIINAKNDYALSNSISQLKGTLRNKIDDIRNKIIYQTAFIETMLDDPENYDNLEYGSTLVSVVEGLCSEINGMIKTFNQGKALTEGIQTVIVGKPNAGKSSLLNVLAGRDRAIVTDIEGTTRDILEENINLGGLSLNIVDTAGIRKAEDIIEKIGVDKTKEYINKADLVLYVVDSSRILDENDERIIRLIHNKKLIVLLNKSDLKSVVNKEDLYHRILDLQGVSMTDEMKGIKIMEISAKEEEGIEDFIKILRDTFIRGEINFNDEVYISNLRHKEALVKAFDSLTKVRESIDAGMPEDFYSIDLMDAYQLLGSITGETLGEDLVNEIFSKFCLGK